MLGTLLSSGSVLQDLVIYETSAVSSVSSEERLAFGRYII